MECSFQKLVYQNYSSSQKMDHTDIFPSAFKTKNHMYSTMAPSPTPRRRYQESGRGGTTMRKSLFERTSNPEGSILNSTFTKEFKDHRRQLKASNLPQIKKEKGFMLEEWLNNALEGSGDIDTTGEPLKTLKKYELDKASLRNLHLSFEAIQKIHKSLFVYSEGIKNAFNEMLAESRTMPRQDNLLPKMYFRAFLKLIQTLSPVKSCFQLIQEDQLKQIYDLKKERLNLLLQIQSQKTLAAERESRLMKQIEEQQSKMKTFKVQYQILESTLQMYEHSFNEQVSLRLKFQEKINIAYNCYDQLKNKYEMLREDIGLKNGALADTNFVQLTIKDQLQIQMLKNEDLSKQLQKLHEKIAIFEGEIVIKNQQIMDLSLCNRHGQQSKQNEQNAIDELILSNKTLKKQKAAFQQKIKDMMNRQQQHCKTIQKLKNDLLYARQKNDDVYIKYHEQTQTIIPLQKDNHEKEKKIGELISQNSILMTKNNYLQNQLMEKSQKMGEMQNQLDINSKNLALYSSQIQQMNANLSELKDIKDRYERYNLILKGQLQQTRKEVNNKVAQIVESKGKNVDLQFHLSEMQKIKNGYEAQMFRLEKEITKKVEALDERKEVQRRNRKQIQKQLKDKEGELFVIKQANKKIMNESNSKDNEKLKKIEEISFLRKNTIFLESSLKTIKNKLQTSNAQLQKKNSQIQNLKKQLEALTFTINKKKDEIDGEIQNLKLTITYLKEKNVKKEQYAHPMVVEDFIEQIARLQMKVEEMKGEGTQMEEIVREMREGKSYEEVLESRRREEEAIMKNQQQIKEEEARKSQPETEKIRLQKETKEQDRELFPQKQPESPPKIKPNEYIPTSIALRSYS